MHTLSDRQERFVLEYAIDQNASAAAGRAGYSPKSRGAQAARLMNDPLVRERIQAELADLFARLRLNATEVLQRQVRAAYLDPAKLFDARQEAIPLEQLDEETRDGLTVSYSHRSNGDKVMRVCQTPRHIALAVLQKRLDKFDKLQQQTYARTIEGEERTQEETREKEVAQKPRPKSFFNRVLDWYKGPHAQAAAVSSDGTPRPQVEAPASTATWSIPPVRGRTGGNRVKQQSRSLAATSNIFPKKHRHSLSFPPPHSA